MKHHCHFLGFIILWALKLKYFMRTLMNTRPLPWLMRKIFKPHLLVDEKNIQTSSQTEELTDEDIGEVNLLLYIKERFNVSNEAYHKLTMLFKHLPRSWKIQDTIREIGWDLIGPEKLNYLGTLMLPKYYPIKVNLLKFHSCGLNL